MSSFSKQRVLQEGIHLADVGEELVAEPSPARALDEAGDVHKPGPPG